MSRDMTRRNFVAAAAATGAVAAVGMAGCAKTEEPTDAQEPQPLGSGVDPFADCTKVYGCCSPECQHHLLTGYVRDGKLVKVDWDADKNECPACNRGFARVEMCNSDQRLTKPLKLVGEKGKGKDQYQEIEWTEAIDLIEEKLRYALDNGGSHSIVSLGGSGNFSNLTGAFSNFVGWLGGGTPVTGNMCCAGIDSGLATIFGARCQMTRHQIDKSKYIIVWGNNPVVTMSGYFGRYQKMMDNGGTLVTVDPFYSETADKSQVWLRPWPGNDSALALGMIKVILDEGLQNDEYIKAHSTAPCLLDASTKLPVYKDSADPTTYQVIDADGTIKLHTEATDPMLTTAGTEYEGTYITELDAVKAEAAAWDADAVKAETDVDFDDYAPVARDFANAPAAMIIQNMGGYQRTENACYATALMCYMAVLCGHVGHEGDGVYDVNGSAHLVPAGSAYESNPDAAPNTEVIPHFAFGDFIEAEKPCKINFAWIAQGNQVSQIGDTNNNYRKGLSLIPFVVKVDQFFNATCAYADLVLPNTALFETPNVTHSARSSFIQISEAGVTPPGEAKTDLEITRMVAERFGLDKYYNEDPDVYIARVIEPAGITLEQLKERKAIDALTELNPTFVAYKDGNFLTPTGKAQFFCQSWVDQGYSGIATHMRPTESILNATTYPLAAVQRKTRSQVHTIFKNLETMLEMDGHQPHIIINTEDAAARGIVNGDDVTAFNDRGYCVGVAVVTDKTKKGVVVLENGWDDMLNGKNTNTNNVTQSKWPTLGTIHTINSTLVDVKKGA